MKYLSVYVFGAILAAAPAMAGPQGVWRSAKNDQGASISVKIYDCGKNICGDIVKIHDSTDKSALGKNMIKGMSSTDGQNYSGGKIFAPDEQKWYIAKMHMNGDNKMDVSGCVLGGLFCRSQTWTREQ